MDGEDLEKRTWAQPGRRVDRAARRRPHRLTVQSGRVTTRRRTGRTILRFAAAVMMVSGVLLMADAIATVAWQEPVSALIAAREQRSLERQLEALRPESARAAPQRPERDGTGDPPGEGEGDRRAGRRRASPTPLRTLAAAYADGLRTGRAIGIIELPTLGRSYAVVEGTDTESLRKGPAHYPGTPLPGMGGTVGVAGHRTTYGAPFRAIGTLERGERIELRMPYGHFSYRVEATRIVQPTALWVTRRVGHERLILSACHPLYSAAQRIVVFARLERAERR